MTGRGAATLRWRARYDGYTARGHVHTYLVRKQAAIGRLRIRYSIIAR